MMDVGIGVILSTRPYSKLVCIRPVEYLPQMGFLAIVLSYLSSIAKEVGGCAMCNNVVEKIMKDVLHLLLILVHFIHGGFSSHWTRL